MNILYKINFKQNEEKAGLKSLYCDLIRIVYLFCQYGYKWFKISRFVFKCTRLSL